MHELAELQQLLVDIDRLVRSGTRVDKRQAADKLQRLASIATTLGFTIRPQL